MSRNGESNQRRLLHKSQVLQPMHTPGVLRRSAAADYLSASSAMRGRLEKKNASFIKRNAPKLFVCPIALNAVSISCGVWASQTNTVIPTFSAEARRLTRAVREEPRSGFTRIPKRFSFGRIARTRSKDFETVSAPI